MRWLPWSTDPRLQQLLLLPQAPRRDELRGRRTLRRRCWQWSTEQRLKLLLRCLEKSKQPQRQLPAFRRWETWLLQELCWYRQCRMHVGGFGSARPLGGYSEPPCLLGTQTGVIHMHSWVLHSAFDCCSHHHATLPLCAIHGLLSHCSMLKMTHEKLQLCDGMRMTELLEEK